VHEKRVSCLKEIDLFCPLGRLGDLLATACVLGAVRTGWASPGPTGRRERGLSDRRPLNPLSNPFLVGSYSHLD
jgi:hypothetical protein